MSTTDIIAIIIVVTIAIIIILLVYNYFVSRNELNYLEEQYQTCVYEATLIFGHKVTTNATTALNEAKNYYSTFCLPIVKAIQQQNPLTDLATAIGIGVSNALTALGISVGAAIIIKSIESAIQNYASSAPTTISGKALSYLSSITNTETALLAYANLENGVYRFYGSVGEFMYVLTGPVVAILKNALYITSGDVINQIASYMNINLAYSVDEILLMFDQLSTDALAFMISNAEALTAIAVVSIVAAVAYYGIQYILPYLVDAIETIGPILGAVAV